MTSTARSHRLLATPVGLARLLPVALLITGLLCAVPVALGTIPAGAGAAPAPVASSSPGPAAPTSVRPAVLPLGERVASYSYAGTTDPNQSLTASWSPARHGAPWVLAIHGGSWYDGSQEWVSDAVRLFYPRGWQVFSMSYRLGQDSYAGVPVTWAQQFADLVAARNWIIAHAAAFGIDPARGTAYGASAGGHMAATIGLMGGFAAVVSVAGVLQPQRVALDAAGMNPTEPSTPQMRWVAAREQIMMGCAYLDDSSPCGRRWRAFDPETRVPLTHLRGMYIVHGTLDPFVPVNTARSFAWHLGRAGIPYRLYVAPGFGHTDADLYQNTAVKADLVQHVLAWSSPAPAGP